MGQSACRQRAMGVELEPLVDGPEEECVEPLQAQLQGCAMGLWCWLAPLVLRLRRRLLDTALLLWMLLLLLWLAVGLYGTLYWTLLPTASLATPVHFYYRMDCEPRPPSVCSFPIANVSLLQNRKQQVMSYGRPYQMSLELEMPESPANELLGMFLVRISCYTHDGRIIDSTARSTMLRYRSVLLQTLATLLFCPLLLVGATEQKQHLWVELHSAYRDKSDEPAVGMMIELQSVHVQVYSATLYIHAQLTGIRFLLYNFPVMSAVVGVVSNFAFLSGLLLLSYLRLTWTCPQSPAQNGGLAKNTFSPVDMDQREISQKANLENTSTESPSPYAAVLTESDDIIMSSCCGLEESIHDPEMEEVDESTAQADAGSNDAAGGMGVDPMQPRPQHQRATCLTS